MKAWINWSNGMKMGAQHLIQLQQSIISHIDGSLALRAYKHQYGYIPSGNVTNLEFLKESNGELIVTRYSGLTANGHWIYFDSEELGYLKLDKLSDGLVELKILDNEFVNFGEPIEGISDQKINLRKKLDVTIVQQPSHGSAVVLGKVVGGKIDRDYVPPIYFLSSIAHKNIQEKIDIEITQMSEFCLANLSTYTSGDARNILITALTTALNNTSLIDSMTPWHIYKKARYIHNAINIYNHSAKRSRKIKLRPFPSFTMTDLNNIFEEIKNMYFEINKVLEGLIEITHEDNQGEVIVK